jgi:hypothetical protein
LVVIAFAFGAVVAFVLWDGVPETTLPGTPTTDSVPQAAIAQPPATAAPQPAQTPAPTVGPAIAMLPLIATPQPDPLGRRPMTVYAVGNPNPAAITVEHVITNTEGFRHSFTSSVGAGEVAEYHLRDIPEVPSPFLGAMTLSAGLPFTASVVGYDYVAVKEATPAAGRGAARPAPQVSVPLPGLPENLSLKRLAWASTTREGSAAANAVDGDDATAWESDGDGAQWLVVDLGASAAITRVTVLWGADYATRYSVDYSLDNKAWRPMWLVADGKGYEATTPIGTARYVRLRITAALRPSGYQLRELHVFGSPAVEQR